MSSWRALRADPLPWLLSGDAYNLHSRVLLELFGRPGDSPAVVRARGASSVCEPVASLLEDLLPDGVWATSTADWQVYSGPAWRLTAALQWGADPADPRLQAALDRLLDSSAGPQARRSPVTLARLLQAAAWVGWWRDPRVVEIAARLEEPEAWTRVDSTVAAVVASAVIHAVAESGDMRRRPLLETATATLLDGLAAADRRWLRLGYPNLLRTDLAEMLSALARADVPYEERMRLPLEQLQRAADALGRWHRRVAVPATLGCRPEGSNGLGPSRWVSLRATIAVLRYAEEAGLERLFPERPEAPPA